MSARRTSTVPLLTPPALVRSQLLPVQSVRVYEPSSSNVVSGVIMPLSSAANAVTSLNVDAGA